MVYRIIYIDSDKLTHIIIIIIMLMITTMMTS